MIQSWRQLSRVAWCGLQSSNCAQSKLLQPCVQCHLSHGQPIQPKTLQQCVRCCTSTTSSNISKRRKPFPPIHSSIDINSDECLVNLQHSKRLEKELLGYLAVIYKGGGEKAIERHTKRNRKLLAEDRLRLVLDEDSDFLELSALAGLRMEYGDIPRAGVLSGFGKVHGVQCMFAVNDATVKGGTMFPVTVKKQIRMQELAIQHRIPFIYIVDSGGAFLPLQADIFPDRKQGGRGFRNEAIMNSLGVPQLAVVVGSCTAGGAYVPTMVQEASIVHRLGTIFLGGPPLVKAALGEEVSAEELGGAALHSIVSGCTDYFAETEQEAFEMARDSVAAFNIHIPDIPAGYDEPLYSPEEIPALIPKDNLQSMDTLAIIARIVDGSRFHQFKAKYGTSLITGFAYIQGRLVGIVASNGRLTCDAATKGSHFVQLCSQRDVPMVFLQNTADHGMDINSLADAEEAGCEIRMQARMMASIATSKVVKVTIVMGNSFGMESYAMAGPAMEPSLVFTWPCARVAMGDPASLAQQLLHAKFGTNCDKDSEEYQKYSQQVKEQVTIKSSALYAASRVWNDGVILPQDTRKVIGQSLDALLQSQVKEESIASVVRM